MNGGLTLPFLVGGLLCGYIADVVVAPDEIILQGPRCLQVSKQILMAPDAAQAEPQFIPGSGQVSSICLPTSESNSIVLSLMRSARDRSEQHLASRHFAEHGCLSGVDEFPTDGTGHNLPIGKMPVTPRTCCSQCYMLYLQDSRRLTETP